MRDSYDRFVAAGVKLYAISYDDQDALAEFAEKQNIPFPLLSDVDSDVIRRYGILNEQIEPGDAILYGVPYPGSYVTDDQGGVVAKFFHDTYKKRDSPETLIDAALGRLELTDDAPSTMAQEGEVRITTAVLGGSGSVRQGVIRRLVVRLELPDGFHVYDEPAPDGLTPVTIDIDAPAGLVFGDVERPDSEPLTLASMGVELRVWGDTVDFVVPFYAVGELVSEVRPLDVDAVDVRVSVRYQACSDETCLLPTTTSMSLRLSTDVVDVPKLSMHAGHGQREGNYSNEAHFRRLLWRKVRAHPLGFVKFIGKTIRLEFAAARRRWGK